MTTSGTRKLATRFLLLTPLFVAPLVLGPREAAAQDSEPYLSLGEQRELFSDVLGESRDIIVGLPAEYEGDNETYPVVYLLDGPSHFHHTTGTTRFLARVDRMPQVIVVAIPNTERSRDLTPPILGESDREPGTTGGADAFLDFIESELKPFIDSNYRTRPYSILIGHSLGGLFANHTLVHRPEIFDAYISISPSLWWDEQRLIEQADAALDDMADLVGDFYMTMGNEGGDMLGGALKFAGVLEEKAPESFRWTFNHMDEESHGSVPHRSTYYGFEKIFEGWNLHDPIALYTSGGFDAIVRHYERTSERFGYDREPPARVLGVLGSHAIEEGYASDAVEIYSLVVEQDRNSVPGNLGLARAHDLMGHRDVAIERLRHVLAIDPRNGQARELLTEYGADMTDIPEVIEVPVEVLEIYVGRYEVPGDESVEFVVDGPELFAILDGRRWELYATEPNRFRVAAAPVLVTFNVDASGAVPTITIEQSGSVVEAKRVN